MKRKIQLVPFGLMVLLSLGCISQILTSHVSAAACSSSNFGQSTFNVNIPAAGEYIIWSRVKATDSSASYRLEIGSNTCYEIGGSSLAKNTWTWSDFQNNDTNNKVKYTFNSPGDYPVKLIGTSSGLELDKLLLLGVNEICETNGKIPLDTGSNCANAPAVVTQPPSQDGTTPPPDLIIPGITTVQESFLPATVSDNPESIKQIEYFIDGRVVQTSDGATPLDTTLLNDGVHDVTSKITYKDGSTEVVLASIAVDNLNTPWFRIGQWIKINKRPLLVFSVGLSIVSSAFIGIVIWRILKHKKMFMPLNRLNL